MLRFSSHVGPIAAEMLRPLFWSLLLCVLIAASGNDETSLLGETEKAPPVDPFAGTVSSEMGCWRCNESTHAEMLEAYGELCNVTMSPMRAELNETYWTRTLAVRALRERVIELQSQCLKVVKRMRRELTLEERVGDLKGPVMKWLQRNAVPTDGFEFGVTEDKGLGVFLTKDVTNAGWLMGVGHNLTMTAETAMLDPVVLTYWSADEWLRNRSDLMLAIHLIRERAKEDESRMSYFINALPDVFDTPLYWSTDDLQELSGTSAFSPALLSNSGPIFDYCRIHLQFPEPGDCDSITPYTTAKKKLGISLQDFLWSWSIVQSRAENQNGTFSLVPIMDFINAADTKSFVYATDAGFYYAVEGGLQEGRELVRDYGNRSSHDVLVSMGFVPEHGSKFDKVVLQLDMRRDRFFRPRLQTLHAIGMMPSGGDPQGDAFYRGSIANDGSPSRELWACARVLSCKSIKKIKGMDDNWLLSPPSPGNRDLKAAKWVLKRVRDAQKRLPKVTSNCVGVSPKCSGMRLARAESTVLERAVAWAKDFVDEQEKRSDGQDDDDDDSDADGKEEL